MDVGRVGVWSRELRSEEPGDTGRNRDAAAELEELGYGTIWLGSSPGVAHAVPLLAATSKIVVATGILNIWEHEASEVAASAAETNARYGGRFLLGLGASHSAIVKAYNKPYSAMVEYLDGLDAAGSSKSGRILAALGPRMLELARDRAVGAHPYLVTPEHTAQAREALGEGPLLAPEIKVAPNRDVAREHLGRYLQLPNYTRNLLRLGYTEEDFTGGGSDRLVDALFATDEPDAVRRRVAEHHDAGADHVCLQIATSTPGLPLETWRRLAE